MIFLGIDPGKSGGWAVVGSECKAGVMPMVDKEIDAKALHDLLKRYQPAFVAVEKAASMSGTTASGGRLSAPRSMFSYGMGYGKIRGILEAGLWPHALVTPQAWKKQILAGTAKDKAAAIEHCRRAYPDINLTPGSRRKPHDGIADAVCIAEYAARNAPRGVPVALVPGQY